MPDGAFQGDTTALRLRLLANGYEPLPITAPGEPLNSAGKRPRLSDWTHCAINEDQIRRWARDLPRDTNTGLRCGILIGIDIDVLDAALAQAVEDLAQNMLGPTPLRRVGRAPKVLLAYRTVEPPAKSATPEMFLPDGTKVQVEVLAAGQQFVSHGIHPDTRQPYHWTTRAPHDTPLRELPLIQQVRIAAFIAACEAVLRQAGARTSSEIKGSKRPDIPPRESRSERSSGFFHEVNRCAFANLDAWVKDVFPAAYWQPNAASPPGAWRISSTNLGRALEEDISIHAREGIQDFGTRESLTPIDLVLRHGAVADAAAAAFWLCDRLSVNPEVLGWRGRHKLGDEARGAGEQRPATPEPTANEPETRIWQDRGAWDPSAVPKRPWVVPSYLMRGSVTVLSGQGAGGKSSLVVAWTISIATGEPLGPFRPLEPATVVSYNTEDDQHEQQRRYSAALIASDRLIADVMPRIIRCGPNEVGMLFEREPDTGQVSPTCAMAELEQICSDTAAAVLVCDPLVELHNAEENDNTAMRAMIAAFRGLAKRLNIAVLLLHHDRKGAATPGDMDRIRGASAISGAARVMLTLTTMSVEEGDKLGVPAQERRRYFRIDGAKSNYAPTTEAEWWRLAPYEIENGEQIAAASPWTPPKAFADLTMADCVAALKRLQAGTAAGHAYGAAKQSGADWAGRVIIDMFGKTSGQATAILVAWVASGVLIEAQRPGPRRSHSRKAYDVNAVVLAEMERQAGAPAAP